MSVSGSGQCRVSAFILPVSYVGVWLLIVYILP